MNPKVLNGIKQQEKWWFIAPFSVGENLIHTHITTLCNLGDAALMDCSTTKLIQATPWHYLQWNLLALCLLDDCQN